jgi:nucleoside-diphosphate-sugar epimerase
MEVAEAVRGSRYVFHLAYGTGGDDPRAVTVNGTENVLRVAAATKVESMVVLSTATVFGHPSTTVDESAPYLPALGEYGRSKAEAERKCLAFARSSVGMRVVVLNPVAVYGPGGRTFTEMPPRMAESGAFCWIEHGRGIANYVYVDNLVDAVLLAAQHHKVNGERFIISDGDCTWKEFLTPILRSWLNRIPSYTAGQLRSLNVNSPQPGIREMVQAAFRNRELMAMISSNRKTAALKRTFVRAFPHLQRRIQAARNPRLANRFVESASGPIVPPLWLADLFGYTMTRVSSSKARQVLGWKPGVDLGEGQRRSIRWLQYVRLVPEEDGSGHESPCRG